MVFTVDYHYTKISSEKIDDYEVYKNFVKEIKETFTVYVPGAHHTKNFKRGTWDGFTCLIDRIGYDLSFLTGYFTIIYDIANSFDLNLSIIDNRHNNLKFKLEELNNYTLRDYQIKAVNAINKDTIIPFYRGICNAATNAGKSIMILSFIKSFNPKKCLVLINRAEIFKELYSTLSSEFDTGRINSKNIDLLNNVVIAMQGSLFNKLDSINVKKYLSEVDMLIVDESHFAISNTYVKLIMSIKPEVIIFTSGTGIDFESDMLALVAIGLSGPVFYKISNKKLIDIGVSAMPTIYLLNNNCPDYFDYKMNYEHNIKFSESRALLIYNALLNNPGFTLISVIHKDHGDFLKMFLHNKGLSVDFIYGGHPNRSVILDEFKEGIKHILITTEILREGVNIPIIDNLVIANGGKSVKRIKQIIGRVLRMNEKKKTLGVKVFDFLDNFKSFRDQSKKRVDIYKNEKFEIVYEEEN